jgi:hypothetical protein
MALTHNIRRSLLHNVAPAMHNIPCNNMHHALD